jgi:dolichyl-phosphate-mannose-protein mannosyltransferase
MKRTELLTISLLFLLSLLVKTYKVESGRFVIWDEAHFGKFSKKYLAREFYFDVHPPLGKMLTSIGGYLFEQPGDFEFKSGEKYPEEFDYPGMRRFHAFIASFTPVLGYLILRELGHSYRRRLLLSLLFIFENGFTCIGRLILLDSHLLTFTAAVAYLMTRLFRRSRKATDYPSLALLGLSLGCVLSIKWIGFLTMALVGLFTLHQLWTNLASKSPISGFVRMLVSRALLLVLLPASVYVALFYLHFRIVNQSSSDDGHMSSFFQAGLKGGAFEKIRKYVAYGTSVTVKSSKTGGGYLHSHNHRYPDSTENQVTTYHHKDENNAWAFQRVTEEDDEEVTFMNENDTVVVMHMETKKYLAVPGEQSLISSDLRVECSGQQLTQLSLFRVEVAKDEIKKEERVKSLTTQFRLRSIHSECYLKSGSKNYPDWGFSQGEVSCTREKGEETLWNIEDNQSEKYAENPIYTEIKKSAFAKNFIEHNKAMFITNKSFVQDEDLEPERIVSKPYEWLIMRRGLRMSAWDGDARKFYMFGNPFIWYSSGLCVIMAPLVFLGRAVGRKRQGRSLQALRSEGYEVFLGCMGWALHYLPFYMVGRVLYFHHYYPALFFALIALSYVLRFVRFYCLTAFVLLSIASFVLFSRLTYGFVDPSKVAHIKLIPTWDFL